MTIAEKENVNQKHQFATFYVGSLMFGVDVQEVQEIIRYQEMTPVPLASTTVRGLINLRGQIITAIDLRRRLELVDRAADSLPMNVVVRTKEGTVSLLIDRVGDVLEIEERRFEVTPNTVDECAREVVKGVYKLDRGLMLVLDTERAVEVPVN